MVFPSPKSRSLGFGGGQGGGCCLSVRSLYGGGFIRGRFSPPLIARFPLTQPTVPYIIKLLVIIQYLQRWVFEITCKHRLSKSTDCFR